MSGYNYEMIEKYVSGQLAGEQLAVFEEQLRSDPSFAQEVELYKAIGNEIGQLNQKDEQKEALQQSLKQLGGEYFKQERPPGKLKYVWWLTGAATVAAALLLFIVKPFAPAQFNNENLYAYYTSEVNELALGQRGGDQAQAMAEATILYNKKNYAQALPLLTELVNKYPADNELLLAKGICLLQIGQTDSSLVVFDTLSAGKTVFSSEGLWYKALVLLKQNQLNACAAVLEQIGSGTDRYPKVQQLLRKIKRKLAN